MLDRIDGCAAALRDTIPAFTRRNLFFAVRRAQGGGIEEKRFEASLRQRLRRGPIPGLLPSPCEWTSRRLTREWAAYFPKAVLLVDRPAVLDLFVASGVMPAARLALVCIDGSPASVVAWLRKGYRAGRRAPVLYLHDAATVAYPFAFEPLRSLVRYGHGGPLPYHDLGLPPLGAPARRFAAESSSDAELVLDLEAVPPAVLVSFVVRRAHRAVPGDPNMLPLARDRTDQDQNQEQART
jgi:hypothetical protein